MYNFGLEITSVFCGTVCPELLAQYHRNIHLDGAIKSLQVLL